MLFFLRVITQDRRCELEPQRASGGGSKGGWKTSRSSDRLVYDTGLLEKRSSNNDKGTARDGLINRQGSVVVGENCLRAKPARGKPWEQGTRLKLVT